MVWAKIQSQKVVLAHHRTPDTGKEPRARQEMRAPILLSAWPGRVTQPL